MKSSIAIAISTVAIILAIAAMTAELDISTSHSGTITQIIDGKEIKCRYWRLPENEQFYECNDGRYGVVNTLIPLPKEKDND